MKNQIKHHPILFNTEMVQAILEGRKTQTRRTIKGLKIENEENGKINFEFKKGKIYHAAHNSDIEHLNTEFLGLKSYSKFKKGDILWVRETFQETIDSQFIYKADEDELSIRNWDAPWKPSIHMPKTAARIFLEITDISIERLNDITEEDAIAEGVGTKIYGDAPFFCTFDYTRKVNKNGFRPGFCVGDGHQYRRSFKTLWQSINGSDSWDANPYVWVVKFKQVQKPKNFLS